MKTILTTWKLATYDVWGNPKDGFEVNDIFRRGEIEIRLKPKTLNPGTPNEFQSAYPSDYQIKQIFGVGCEIETDGDDTKIYVNRKRDSFPIGELTCVSHKHLSPVKALDKSAEIH